MVVKRSSSLFSQRLDSSRSRVRLPVIPKCLYFGLKCRDKSGRITLGIIHATSPLAGNGKTAAIDGWTMSKALYRLRRRTHKTRLEDKIALYGTSLALDWLKLTSRKNNTKIYITCSNNNVPLIMRKNALPCVCISLALRQMCNVIIYVASFMQKCGISLQLIGF